MTHLKKIIIGACSAAAIIGTASVAGSHAAKSDNPAVAARHFQMQMIGYHTGLLGAIAKGDAPFDAAKVEASAKNLAALARMAPATLWVAGTEQGAATASRAKPEVWSDSAGFAKSFEELARASDALMTAGDVDAVRAGMGALGQSCKNRHQTYRGPKN